MGGDAGGVSFQVWMHTVNSISKKEGDLCRKGNRYLLYTVTAFTVLQLPFKLCHERRSYLENLSMLLMKKSVDKKQGWGGTCILGCHFWALTEEGIVLSQWLCCLL